MLRRIKISRRSLSLLGEAHTLTPFLLIPTIAQRSCLQSPVSASLRNLWLFSSLTLLIPYLDNNVHIWDLGSITSPTQGNRRTEVDSMDVGWPWHCFQTLSSCCMKERLISVTPFADHLPRGHDLSVFLVPSSPDVLDPFWNAHARNPGKRQPFHKSDSDLVIRWETSARRYHYPSQSHLSY